MAFFDPADTDPNGPQGQGGIPLTDPTAPPTIYTAGSLTHPTTPMPTTLPPQSTPLPGTPPPRGMVAPGQFNPNPSPAPPPGTRLAPTFNPTTPLPGQQTQQTPYILPKAGTLTNTVPFGTTPPPAAKTTPTTTTTSTGDPLRDWIIAHAPANIKNDPGGVDYWYNAIKNNGGLTDNMDYWVGRLNTPDTGGSGGAGGFGAFTAPYTGTYVPPVTNFTAPVGTDDPGFKFAVEQGQDAIARSAAAKGNLLTGGTLKDLASYTTGAALQDYAGSYNRALSTAGFNNNTAFQAFGQNYDIFRNNQNDPFQKLYATTGLGLNAAGNANSALGNYSGNLSDLTNNFASQYVNATFGQGNANAAGTQISSAQRNQFYQGLSDYLKNYHF